PYTTLFRSDGERGIAERFAQPEQALGDRLRRPVHGEFPEGLVVAHAPEPLTHLAARALRQRIADTPEEVHRARLGLVLRAPVGVRDVDRDDDRDLAAAGVASLAAPRMIAADGLLELADAGRAHREEDRQPGPAD